MRRGITPRAGAATIIGRVLFVVALAWLAAGRVVDSMSRGDVSGDDLVRFVLIVWAWGHLRGFARGFGLLRERRELRKLRGYFDAKELGAALAELKHHRGPFVVFIRNLHRQFQLAPSAVDASALGELLHERMNRTPDRLERLVRLMLSLGFAGTALGLVSCLNGLGAAVAYSSNQGAQLMPLLFGQGGPLSAMGGAFFSTLVALACGAVALRWLSHALRDSGDDLHAQFIEFVETEIIPKLRGGGGGPKA